MWLHNKIAAAQTAVEAFNADGATPPPTDLSRRILNSVGVKLIAIVTPAGRRDSCFPASPPHAAEAIAADDSSYFEGIEADLSRPLRRARQDREVASTTLPDQAAIEVTFDETPLIEGAVARLA